MSQPLLFLCLAILGCSLLIGSSLALVSCCAALTRGFRRLVRRRSAQPIAEDESPLLREARELEALLSRSGRSARTLTRWR